MWCMLKNMRYLYRISTRYVAFALTTIGYTVYRVSTDILVKSILVFYQLNFFQRLPELGYVRKERDINHSGKRWV